MNISLEDPSLLDMRMLYAVGKVGFSVRMAILRGKTVDGVRDLLVFFGFKGWSIPLSVRGPDGRVVYVRFDGSTTENPGDGRIVLTDAFEHEDHGFVRIFEHGDPSGKHVPAGKPSAIKSVLYPRQGDPLAREALRLSDETEAYPADEQIHLDEEPADVGRWRRVQKVRSAMIIELAPG